MADEKQTGNSAKPARPDLQFDPRDVSVRNTSGSTAGSGSGDFHVYRQERLRELTRLKTLEAEAAAKVEQDAKLAEYQARVEKEAVRSQSRAAKRKRKKLRSANAAIATKKAKSCDAGVLDDEESSMQRPGERDDEQVDLAACVSLESVKEQNSPSVETPERESA